MKKKEFQLEHKNYLIENICVKKHLNLNLGTPIKISYVSPLELVQLRHIENVCD